MTFSFERKLILFFSIILIGIVFIVLATFRNSKSIVETNQWVQHTHKVLYESEQVLSTVQDIVLSRRGFVITGDSNFLKPFFASTRRIDEQIQNLTKDNLSQQGIYINIVIRK